MSSFSGYKKEFESILLSHAWGNKANAGKAYKRKYSKTAKQKKAMEKK